MGRSSRLNRGPRDGRDACDAFIRKASRHVTASRSGTTVTDYTDSNSSRLSRVLQKPRKSVISSGGTVTRIQNVTACHGRHEETRRRMYGSARDALIRVTAYGRPSRPKNRRNPPFRRRPDTTGHHFAYPRYRACARYALMQRWCPVVSGLSRAGRSATADARPPGGSAIVRPRRVISSSSAPAGSLVRSLC